LRERGFRVSLAHGRHEAALELKESTFKVVLIDLRIPDGDGGEVFRMVRAANPQARTVVITGYRSEMDELVEQMMVEGADGVFYKPFDVPELVQKLKHLAGAHKEGG
jgi:DNA-binding response OmpR family regulator